MPKRDLNTLDMFMDWTPPDVALSIPADAARGGTISSQIARAVGHALRDADMKREDIAKAMSDFLGENVTKNMLDAYSSQAREEHRITLERFIALIEVTGQQGLLGFVAAVFGLIVVPEKYQDLIELHFIEEQQKKLEQRKSAMSARWGMKR